MSSTMPSTTTNNNNPSFAPMPSSGSAIKIGAKITDIQLQNTGAAQTNVPFTFGQVIAAGAMSPKDGLVAKLADGTVLNLQTDVKATHADGSVRHVVISGVLPALAVRQSQPLELLKAQSPRRRKACSRRV